MLTSASVYQTLSCPVGQAAVIGGVEVTVTVDLLSVTVDSTLVIISDEGWPPGVYDSDADGIGDTEEELRYGTDPLDPDSDGDGLPDGLEVMLYGTSPTDFDTDQDGASDGYEVVAGTDPLDDDFRPMNDGDINRDGEVDVVDSLLATRIVQGDIQLTSQQFLHMDVAPLVNGYPGPDARLTIGDLVVITRKALGLIDF